MVIGTEEDTRIVFYLKLGDLELWGYFESLEQEEIFFVTYWVS